MTRAHHLAGWRIDITVRPGVPRLLPGAEVARVVARSLEAAGAPRPASISVVLSDDEELTDLNEGHLGHDGPTDVLSFPILPPEAYPPHEGAAPAVAPPAPADVVASAPFVLPPGRRPHLGDIVVSVERAIAQAGHGRGGQTGDVSWDAADELRLLLTHGTLHVCGWDHAEPAEETAMRALERALLAAGAGSGGIEAHGARTDPERR